MTKRLIYIGRELNEKLSSLSHTDTLRKPTKITKNGHRASESPEPP